MLWHALLLSHQPHDNTYGLAATPDGQTVFVDSRHCIYRSQDAGDSWQKANGAGLPLVAGGIPRSLLLVVPIVLLAYATSSWTLLCRLTGQFAGDYSWRCEFVFEYDPD